eukprot:159736_1
MADEFFSQRYKTQRLNRDLSQDLNALSTPVKSDEKADPFKLESIDSNPFKQQADADAIGGYSIHDLLNGYVKDEDTLLAIDECLITISSEWDLSDILSKNVTDCERFVTQKCKQPLSSIVSSIIDPPHILYDMLLLLARKMKAISLVGGNQKMIYVPTNIEELEEIGSQLQGLNHLISVRTNRVTGHKSVSAQVPEFEDSDEDSKSFTPPEPAPFVPLGGSDTKHTLESLIFCNREYYRDSAICRHRETKFTENKAKSSAVALLGNATRLVRPKSEDMMKEQITNNAKMKINPNAQEMTELDYHKLGGNTPAATPKPTAPSKKGHPNNICCEGCGNPIKFADDYERIIVYTVPIKQNALFYFHDTFCVSLRRLQESIRRYVMDRSLPEARRAETTTGYIRNLLMNFNTLITTMGVLPRPSPLKSLSKSASCKTEQHVVMRFHRASAYKLILRQQALDAREAKNFEDEYAWKFKTIPNSIQYADMVVYGPCLAEFVIQQLLSKQLESLWLSLAFIVSGMTATTSLQIIEEHRTHLAKVKEIQYLDVMLTSMIEAADYTIAMALYLSAYMMQNAENDLSRSEHFERVASKYIRTASKLVGSVESDHLLSLLLETPTDIAHLSVFEIVLKYEICDFMDDSRIQMLMAQMWCQYDFLDPATNFRTSDMELFEVMTLLVRQPSRFYYCPVGRYWTSSVMYLVYICVVSSVILEQNYELASHLTGAEYVMWIFNVGFVVGELTQMSFEGVAYLTDVGNYFDMLIILNWCILFVMRYGCKYARFMQQQSQQCYASNRHKEIDDALSRNNGGVLIYMSIFCLQICILWSRLCLVFSMSRTIGPFISMLPGMARDILQWSFVLSIFYIGYSFGIYFIIAGDISAELCASEGDMSDFSMATEYNFILLMGQSEWSLLEASACIDGTRSLLIKLYTFGFSVLGTVLLLNLLIAMMASTYEQIRGGTAKQVNFARGEQTFTLSHRDAIIPPPLNVLVFVFSVIWFLMEFLVWLLTCGHFILNIQNLLPVRIDYALEQIMTRKTYCCGLLQKVKHPKAFIVNFWTNYSRTARYCQYCRCYMRVNGDISRYFKLFVNYRLDEADVKFMKSLMQNAGICPQCYRPYRIYEETESGVKSNRLYRWQVMLELLSFYVFMIVVYVPLTILIALPAAFSAILGRFDNIKSATKLVARERQIVKDDKYVQLVENIIEKESTTDTELISTQVAQLNRKLIQIKMNQQSSASVLSLQSTHLEDYSRILQGLVPYIKNVDGKLHQLSELNEEEELKHAKEVEVFSQELKEQRRVRQIESAKLAKQSTQETDELQKEHHQELNTLQKQIEEREFLRTIEERKRKDEEQKGQLMALKLEQDMAIVKAQMEELRVVKEAEDKKTHIELEWRRQQENEAKEVEKEILSIKNEQKVDELQSYLLMKKERQESHDDNQENEIKNIQYEARIQELRQQMSRLIQEEESIQNEKAQAKRKGQKDKMKHQIQIGKIKQQITRLQLNIVDEEEEEEEEEEKENDDDRVP